MLALAAGAADTGYVEMPPADDGSYVLVSPSGSDRSWGLPETIRYLRLLAAEWRHRHPGGPVVRIGDLSRRDGGEFPPHKTHRDGCSIDLTTLSPNICHVDREDQGPAAELARLAIDLGARQILYNGERVQAVDPRVIQAWPLHDDHFHIVVDPARVPVDGIPLVVPAASCPAGGWLGTDGYRDGALRLGWAVIPDRRAEWTARLELREAGGEVLLDTGEFPDRRRERGLKLALASGGRYEWRVSLRAPGEPPEAAFTGGWFAFQTDLDLPSATPLEPAEGAEVVENPVLRWGYEDPGGGPQAWFEVEASTDPRRARVTSLGRVPGAATAWTLQGRLKGGRTVHWRVRVSDGRGNEGVSPWASFRVAEAYRWRPPVARVGPEKLNLRAGPGTSHPVLAELAPGLEVTILEERSGWVRVQAVQDSRALEGWVSGEFLHR
ncbi:MAG: SH3 domain-containing protein [Planctomycetes bacterium]|nr:SH3 domain-containing protein [Planctomycetota bacterium]